MKQFFTSTLLIFCLVVFSQDELLNEIDNKINEYENLFYKLYEPLR